MLMLEKKTIALCPFAATLIPEPQAFYSSHETRAVSSPAILDVAFAFRHPHALSRMKVTSLKTYPYTQSASTERPSVEAP